MKVFAIAFAAAMCAIAAGYTRHSAASSTATNLWIFVIGPAASCVVLAIAHLGRDITPTFKHLLALLALTQLGFWERESFELPNHPEASILAIVFLVGGAWELATRGDATRLRRLQSLLRRLTYPQFLILAGAALVLVTPFLPMAFGPSNTDDRWAGWLVLAGRTPWVTADIGLASAPFGPSTPAMKPIFNVAGRAFYAVALAVSLATIVLLALRLYRARVARAPSPASSSGGSAGLPGVTRGQGNPALAAEIQRSPAARRLGAAALLVAAWAATDLFWGWHFDLNGLPWTVYVGLGCWAAALLYAAVMTARIARGGLAGLPGFVLFQFPFVAFNCAVLPLYWTSDVNLAGLGLLFLGAQAQAWGYASLLMDAAGAHSGESRAAAADGGADHGGGSPASRRCAGVTLAPRR